MKYQVYNSPLELSSYVRYFWTIDHEDDGGKDKSIKIFADRFPRLIFQDLNGHVATKDESGLVLPESFLSGIITKQTNYHVKGSYSHLGVSFYPHAIKAIFGIDAYEVTNSLPDLINFGAGELVKKLQDTAHYRRVEMLSDFLIRKLRRQNDAGFRINPIVHSTIDYTTSVNELLSRHKLTERSLERLFKNSIGVAPKKYLRILRFEKAVELLNRSDITNFAQFAYGFNYADQSHFNKEFKDFSGFTPQVFQSKVKLGQESSSFLLK
jgi:AraC-like DNA-binding protein